MQCDFSIDNGQSINRPDDVQVFRNHASGGDQHVSFSAKALAFLLQCVHATLASGPGNGCLVRLIIPLQAGYIARSDIIPLRLQDSEHVDTAVSLADPL